MKILACVLLISGLFNGIAFAQDAEEPSPIYFNIRITNDSGRYSSSALKGVALRAIEKNILSRFVRSYDKNEANACVVRIQIMDIKNRMGTVVGSVLHVETRIENYSYTQAMPLIFGESAHLGYMGDTYSMDFIRSTVDEAVASAFTHVDELLEVLASLAQAEEG